MPAFVEMNNNWNRRWALTKKIKFDFMTRYIMEHMRKIIDFKGKRILELGSGSGRLSYLMLEQNAAHVTLLDSSSGAIEIAKNLFANQDPTRFEIIKGDVLEYHGNKFDVVFSSGVIEHFKSQARCHVIRKHIELCLQDCLIIHPADTWYANFFGRFPLSVTLYGYAKSFSEYEITKYLNSIREVGTIKHETFYPFYTMPMLHNLEFANRMLDRVAWCRKHGQLMLTHARLSWKLLHESR